MQRYDVERCSEYGYELSFKVQTQSREVQVIISKYDDQRTYHGYAEDENGYEYIEDITDKSPVEIETKVLDKLNEMDLQRLQDEFAEA